MNLRRSRALDRSKQVRVVSLQSIKERGRYSNTDLSPASLRSATVCNAPWSVPRVCLYLSTRCKRSASRVCARERESRVPPGKRKTTEPSVDRKRKRDGTEGEKRGRKRERIRRTERKVRKEEKGEREREREGGIPREQYCERPCVHRVYIHTLRRVTHCAHAGARTRDRHRDT